MLRLNAIALFLFVIINVLAYKLCWEQFPVRTRILRKVCILLLGGNLLRYLVIYPFFYHIIKIPAEFSTVAYFLVPTIFLARKQTLHSWAAYSGLTAGFFYYAAMILAGQTIYGADAPVDVCISLLCHGSLYFIGSVSICTERYPRKGWGMLFVGTCYVALRAAILRPLVLGRNRMLIYLLIDAAPARLIFPESAWSRILPVYYTLVFLFILLSIAGFYARNERQYQTFSALRPAC